MGRIGISSAEVEEAALQLQGQGRVPTIDNVREMIGSGSKTTISQYLKAWKAKQVDPRSSLPQELMALVTGLWERLQSEADQRIDNIVVEHSNNLAALQSILVNEQSRVNSLQAELQESLVACEKHRSEKEEWEQQWSMEQIAHGKLQLQYQSISQQVEDSKMENTRLHQLANNMQSNVEHYQRAMQQLRIDQTMENEKQQAVYHQDILSLKQQLSSVNTAYYAVQRQYDEHLVKYQQLAQSVEKQEQLYEALNEDYKRTHHDAICFKERSELLQHALNEKTQEIVEKNQLMKGYESQIALLSDQTHRLQEQIKLSQDQIELLVNEKWDLIQKKSQLEGFLHQATANDFLNRE